MNMKWLGKALMKIPLPQFGLFGLKSIALIALLTGQASAITEIPYFSKDVQSQKLPPIQQRLPDTPAIADFSTKNLGNYGGRIRMLMAKAKDIRMMTVYGYARLIANDEQLNLKPDILESFDIDEGRIFTLHLRKGHRWSDGHLFTAEDFRFFWEDVANNEDLSPFGPLPLFKVDGQLPLFSVIDEHTVRFEWSKPNPYFIPALAGPSPTYIYRPAHYLKQFHKNYNDAETLKKRVDSSNKKNWRKLFLQSARQYRFTNPELPTLQPWYNTTKLPAERFIFKRNPYYHRVDPNGQQLPYVDEIEINLASNSLIPAKVGSGETDLQARYLRMDNYTFLKAAENEGGKQKVLLWQTARGSHMALYPNLNAVDPQWRKMMQDVRFRRALSLAVNRAEINEVVYFGLALDKGNTVLPTCPFYEEDWANAWAAFDTKQANDLLDEMGLTERDDRGIRLLPDGSPLEIVVQTAGESTEETDVLELVTDSWQEAGIKLYTKATQREVLRNRVFSGQAHMSIWFGLPNGIPTPEMSPAQLAPTQQDQLQWSQWGRFYQTGEGEAPDMPDVKQLASLNADWANSIETDQKRDIWRKMLNIHAEQVYSIGLVSGVLQPIVINNRLQNVPEKGTFNWDPGAFFGIYRPDTFWFKGENN